MPGWKKVDCFAEGVIYACGNRRKIVSPGKPDIYYELGAHEVRWYRNSSDDELTGLRKDEINE